MAKKKGLNNGKVKKLLDLDSETVDIITAEAESERITFKPKAQQILKAFADKKKVK